MKSNEIKDTLHCDVLSKRAGVYQAKWSYFYTHGASATQYAELVKKQFPDAKIVDQGNHWHAFVGGSRTGSSTDTYFWVKFKLGNNDATH